jgi:hypothetical protein
VRLLGWSVALLAALAGWAVWDAHRDDAALRADCEARGGIFFHARNPAHVCAALPPLRCLRTETGLAVSPVLARGRDRLAAIPYTACAEWGPR